MADQALEGILKLSKLLSLIVLITDLVPECYNVQLNKPGMRQDNLFTQYQGNME